MAPGGKTDWADVRKRMAAAAEATEAALNPSPERTQERLEQRVRLLASRPPDGDGERDAAAVMSFTLSGCAYAIEIRYVLRVAPLKNVTAIPRTPVHVIGVYDLRGLMLPVFDLRSLLALPSEVPIADPQVIFCGDGHAEFGIAVDDVTGVDSLHADDLSRPPDVVPAGDIPWAKGKDGSGRTVLDGAALLEDARLFIE